MPREPLGHSATRREQKELVERALKRKAEADAMRALRGPAAPVLSVRSVHMPPRGHIAFSLLGQLLGR